MAVYTVARLTDLPEGRGRVVRAGGRDIALFRVEGRVFALDNCCQHLGGPLGEGEAVGGYAVCPWHGWRYDLESGENPLSPQVRVATFRAWVDGDEVRVEVA